MMSDNHSILLNNAIYDKNSLLWNYAISDNHSILRNDAKSNNHSIFWNYVISDNHSILWNDVISDNNVILWNDAISDNNSIIWNNAISDYHSNVKASRNLPKIVVSHVCPIYTHRKKNSLLFSIIHVFLWCFWSCTIIIPCLFHFVHDESARKINENK